MRGWFTNARSTGFAATSPWLSMILAVPPRDESLVSTPQALGGKHSRDVSAG